MENCDNAAYGSPCFTRTVLKGQPAVENTKMYALILAGGKSRRMGHDKTLIQFNGKSFLEYAVEFWESVPEIGGIYLSVGSREHLEILKQDETSGKIIEEERVIPVFDKYEGCGPMAGMLAGFEAGDADLLYVSAIDIVRINRSLLIKADDPEADAYIYEYGDFTEPLFGIYSRRLVPAMEELLESGIYKIKQLLKRGNTKYIPLREDQQEFFLNCNTPEELEKLKKENITLD